MDGENSINLARWGKVPLWARYLTHAQLLVFIAISACMDQYGRAYPGHDWIMAASGCSKNTVWKALRFLESIRALVPIGRECNGSPNGGKKGYKVQISLPHDLLATLAASKPKSLKARGGGKLVENQLHTWSEPTPHFNETNFPPHRGEVAENRGTEGTEEEEERPSVEGRREPEQAGEAPAELLKLAGLFTDGRPEAKINAKVRTAFQVGVDALTVSGRSLTPEVLGNLGQRHADPNEPRMNDLCAFLRTLPEQVDRANAYAAQIAAALAAERPDSTSTQTAEKAASLSAARPSVSKPAGKLAWRPLQPWQIDRDLQALRTQAKAIKDNKANYDWSGEKEVLLPKAAEELAELRRRCAELKGQLPSKAETGEGLSV